jgi:hypothetical protein
MPDLELFAATDLAQVKAIFQDHSIQHVFMGAGVELKQRLEIVRTGFEESQDTTVQREFSANLHEIARDNC